MPDRPDDTDMNFLKLHRPINPGRRNEDNEGRWKQDSAVKKIDPDSQGLANTKTVVASRVAVAAKYLRRTGIKRPGIKMRVAGNLDWPACIGYAVGCGFDRIVFSIQTLRRGPRNAGRCGFRDQKCRAASAHS
jgi:hypothetical protein